MNTDAIESQTAVPKRLKGLLTPHLLSLSQLLQTPLRLRQRIRQGRRSAYVARFSLTLQVALWINALIFVIICGG